MHGHMQEWLQLRCKGPKKIWFSIHWLFRTLKVKDMYQSYNRGKGDGDHLFIDKKQWIGKREANLQCSDSWNSAIISATCPCGMAIKGQSDNGIGWLYPNTNVSHAVCIHININQLDLPKAKHLLTNLIDHLGSGNWRSKRSRIRLQFRNPRRKGSWVGQLPTLLLPKQASQAIRSVKKTKLRYQRKGSSCSS